MYYNQDNNNQSSNLSVDDLLAQATAAVMVDNQIVGTAWLVGNDGELLTAGHLLGAADFPLPEVTVQLARDIPRLAYRVDSLYQPERGIDFAVLKLHRCPPNRRPLPVSLVQSVEGRFRLLGYGRSLVHCSTGYGEFTGIYDLHNNPSCRLFRLRSTELTEGGYSGGAVFSEALQAVVGIQIEAMTPTSRTGQGTVFAMPLYRIVPYWQSLAQLDSRPVRPSVTPSHLHQILLNSGYFHDESQWRSLLADPRLSSWQTQIPLATDPASRVTKTVDFLASRFNRQGVDGVTLLLQVLVERMPVNHPVYQELQQLLAHRGGTPSPAQPVNQSTSANHPAGCSLNLGRSSTLLVVAVVAIVATTLLIGLTEAAILGGVAVVLLVGYYFYDQSDL